MRAGSLRHRCTIQTPARTESAVSGEVVTMWPTLREVWVKIEPLTAREFERYAQNAHQVTHKLTLRHARDIPPDCRIVLGSRIFHPSGVMNVDERKRELQIVAAEGSS